MFNIWWSTFLIFFKIKLLKHIVIYEKVHTVEHIAMLDNAIMESRLKFERYPENYSSLIHQSLFLYVVSC